MMKKGSWLACALTLGNLVCVMVIKQLRWPALLLGPITLLLLVGTVLLSTLRDDKVQAGKAAS